MKLVCIRSDHAWLYPHDFSWLRPTRKIQQWIDGTTSRFQGNVVGIHIRRGDFTARQTTPLKAFVAAMDARLAANPGTSFFLCSDDASIKTELASRYSGKLVTRETDPSRDSPAGLEDAAADLFCLSRCDEILGSKSSSFSEVAHHIGRTRLSFPTIPSPNHHGL